MSALRHPDWHLFAEQRFRRRSAVETSRQSFRGEPYIVLSDKITGQHVRLAARAQDIWQLLDGKRTAQEIWEDLIRRPNTAPTQSELVDWLLQLVQSGLLLSDHDLDPEHLTERTTKRRSGMIEQRAASPLAIKVKLFDPDRLVRATWPLVGWLFTRLGGLVVAATLLTALVLAVLNAEALRLGADSLLLSQIGLLGLVLAYPVMKALHELAHCYALYRFGGRVREFGVMFLVLFPVPYVEASDASAFPDKRARMLVGGAGILAELMIASLALFLWLALEPGVERAILFNFIVIGSISTILFNGNPLLKFDAYFVLADWLEMPNLAQRSGDYLADRFLWRICGLRREIEPRAGEGPILAIYGTLSLAYRVMLTLTIALIVSNWFFVIGILLGVWAVIMGIFWPLFKTARKGARMARTQNRTGIAALRLGLFLAAVVALSTLVPLPFMARGEGQIVPRPEAQIIAGTSGQVAEVLVEDGDAVRQGQVLIRMSDPEIEARLQAMEVSVAFLTEALGRSGLGPLERQRMQRELEVASAVRDEALERAEALELRAPFAGRLAWVDGQAPLAGRFLFRGDALGNVVAATHLDMVIALPAAFSGVARQANDVAILMPDGQELTRPLSREQVVDVGGQVPRELLASGGGPVPEQPDNPGHALDTVWLVWADPGSALVDRAGMRFDARVDLGNASLAEQAVFHLRRLFVRVIRV